MKDFANLSDQQIEAYQAALAEHIGPEAARPGWLRRAVLAADGSWLLAVSESKERDLGPRHTDAPWAWPGGSPKSDPPTNGVAPGLAVIVRHLPLAEGVQLLRSDLNPEVEVDRRARLTAEASARAGDHANDARQARMDEQRRIADHRAKRPARWAALSADVKALYLAAADRPTSPSQALIFTAQHLQRDTGSSAPPHTFESELLT